MRQTILLAMVVAIAVASLTSATVAGQQPPSGPAFVAFRVDSRRVIATLKVMDTPAPEVTDGLSAEPIARFGYRYFDPPASWREQGAAEMRPGDLWLIHSAGEVFHAETERIVGGLMGCQNAVGVLLRVAPAQSDAFTAVPAKYFVAERDMPLKPSKAESSSVAQVAPSPSTADFRRALESTLNQLLARELPGVLADAAPDLARMASSTVANHRSWAGQQQAINEAMQSGRSKLTYDIQSFRLTPDGALLHFVRAEWLVQRQQGFAASLWLRGEQTVDVIEVNVRPASWLRMFEFQGAVAREHLGLVLNILDKDHDGWGEVLLAQGGYESMTISLLEYSPNGFQPTGIEHIYGC
jgi:hypothetical protein